MRVESEQYTFSAYLFRNLIQPANDLPVTYVHPIERARSDNCSLHLGEFFYGSENLQTRSNKMIWPQKYPNTNGNRVIMSLSFL
jgi:hypothetical protein